MRWVDAECMYLELWICVPNLGVRSDNVGAPIASPCESHAKGLWQCHLHMRINQHKGLRLWRNQNKAARSEAADEEQAVHLIVLGLLVGLAICSGFCLLCVVGLDLCSTSDVQPRSARALHAALINAHQKLSMFTVDRYEESFR